MRGDAIIQNKKQLQAALDQLAENDKPFARAYGEYGVPPLHARLTV